MTLHLFEAYGVELEYMIVDQQSLNIRPIADQLFASAVGHIVSDVAHDDIDWSNELVSHVVELKTSKPCATLSGLSSCFQRHIETINDHLQQLNSQLMPSASHPWMDPNLEMQLWPHDCNEIYRAFNDIFDCRGHGWANLQSMHLNLPFSGAERPDDEFGRLHAAIRLVLPLLPAIAASSPVLDGRLTGLLDSRLDVYRTNARRLKTVVGEVIPEAVFTADEYHSNIFEPMFAEIAPYDRNGVLKDEFLNARGAIARFIRGSIEIRVIDVQECPAVDIAVAHATISVLKGLVAEQWVSLSEQQAMPVEPLRDVLLATIREADQASITDACYLRLLGFDGDEPIAAADVWRDLIDRCSPLPTAPSDVEAQALQVLLRHGPLARRLMTALGANPDRDCLGRVYRQLCNCLRQGEVYIPE